MAIFFSANYDRGDFSEYTNTLGAQQSVTSALSVTGRHAHHVSKRTPEPVFARHRFAQPHSVVYGRAYVRYASWPTGGTNRVIRMRTAAGPRHYVSFHVTSNGQFQVNVNGARTALLGMTLTLNTWHLLEWRVAYRPDLVTVNVRRDGGTLHSVFRAVTPTAIVSLHVGASGSSESSVDVYIDAVALDDSDWIGAGFPVGVLETVFTGRVSSQSSYTLADVANHSDLTIFTKGDEQDKDVLRTTFGYTRPILQYVLTGEAAGPHPSNPTDPNFVPFRNNVAWKPGDFRHRLHPNESWFLHGANGNRIATGDPAGNQWVYYMNPANPGWRDFVVRRLRLALMGGIDFDGQQEAALGYDGVFLDNVALQWSRPRELGGGTIREFPTLADFRSAWIGLLQTISAALRPAWRVHANLIAGSPASTTLWNDYMPFLDGAMDEFVTGTVARRYNATEIDNLLIQIETVISSGKSVYFICQGNPQDLVYVTYTLACYFLVADGRNVFFRYAYDYDYRRNWHRFPLYATVLGVPRGPRFEIPAQSGRAWRRDFSNGHVIVTNDAANGIHTGQIVVSA
ncbi:MAG TPA: putative glycoside hydrolase [Ardenticatenaceae bacterium]|nr:putative glycoside hydrolase [Ardenticatenaceae bacterium]